MITKEQYFKMTADFSFNFKEPSSVDYYGWKTRHAQTILRYFLTPPFWLLAVTSTVYTLNLTVLVQQSASFSKMHFFLKDGVFPHKYPLRTS